MPKLTRLILLILFLITAAGCGGTPEPIEATLPPEITDGAPEPTITSPAPEPTSTTAAPPLVIVLAPDGADPDVTTKVEAQVSALASERGLRWQLRQEMSTEEIAAEADYVVVIPPQNDINGLISGAPGVNFLAIDIPGAEPAPNLILVRTPGDLTEIEAFVGGYIGALVTDDWRIGIITVEDDGELPSFTAFENGMRFFCGLCRPQYAPFYAYPFKLSLPEDASDAEWRALADFMRDRLVRTVYISPGAGGSDLMATLASLDVNIIGSTPPPQGLEDNWVASMRVEPNTAYETYVPRLLDGEADLVVTLPIQILDQNLSLFGVGRQRLAQEILEDLLSDFILPGDLP